MAYSDRKGSQQWHGLNTFGYIVLHCVEKKIP